MAPKKLNFEIAIFFLFSFLPSFLLFRNPSFVSVSKSAPPRGCK